MEYTEEINYKALGNSVKKIRETLKYTQEELAEKSGYSVSHIRNIENNNAHPSLSTVVQLANVMKISLDFLLEDSLEIEIKTHDDVVSRLMEGCTNQQKKTILAIIQLIKGEE